MTSTSCRARPVKRCAAQAPSWAKCCATISGCSTILAERRAVGHQDAHHPLRARDAGFDHLRLELGGRSAGELGELEASGVAKQRHLRAFETARGIFERAFCVFDAPALRGDPRAYGVRPRSSG